MDFGLDIFLCPRHRNRMDFGDVVEERVQLWKVCLVFCFLFLQGSPPQERQKIRTENIIRNIRSAFYNEM
jgi:hypothetical protein